MGDCFDNTGDCFGNTTDCFGGAKGGDPSFYIALTCRRIPISNLFRRMSALVVPVGFGCRIPFHVTLSFRAAFPRTVVRRRFFEGPEISLSYY